MEKTFADVATSEGVNIHEDHLRSDGRCAHHPADRERVECEVIRLNDRVAVDIGPGERVVAIEVLDASELIPGLKERGISLENVAVTSTATSGVVRMTPLPY